MRQILNQGLFITTLNSLNTYFGMFQLPRITLNIGEVGEW